jgi:lantibiotic biosynthesis protein
VYLLFPSKLNFGNCILIEEPMLQEVAKEKIKCINEILFSSKPQGNGLLGGNTGLMYYYYHAAKVLNDNILLRKAEKLLEAIFEDLNNGGGQLQGPLFSNGAAGFAYTINYLQKNQFIEFSVEENFTDLDEYLFNQAIALFEKDNIDYLHGATGIFHYFLSRDQTPTISNYLNKLCPIFCNKAVETKSGSWFVNLGLQRLTNNTVDFGLAHGLTGFLLLLLKAWVHVDDKALVEKTVRAGIQYILNHELPVYFDEEEYSFFPFNFESDATELTRVNRLAWCYGDLNMLLVLYRAGNTFCDRFYTETADRLGPQILKRKTVEATFCVDSHFCHGTAGLAQFYRAIYNDTLNHMYYKEHEYWIQQTLALINNEIVEKKYDKNPISFLEGWSGVAMVLVDYVAFHKTKFGEILLL